MKEIFDVNRFGKYFAYDVRSAVSTYGLPMLILGLWPFIWLIFSYLLSFIFGHDVGSDQTYRAWPFVVMVIVGLSFGARVYGGVTDRKKGTDWISLPASALEKTLSLLLVTCVVVPAALLALTAVSNVLVSLFVPDFGSVLPFEGMGSFISDKTDGNFFNFPLILWLNWCENILFFTLGALCFKRNKVGKSILCYIGLAMLIGILMMLFFHTTSLDNDALERFFGDIDAARAQTWINVALNVIYTVVFALLIGGIYARIKTIKA
jgi:hypothetical protein